GAAVVMEDGDFMPASMQPPVSPGETHNEHGTACPHQPHARWVMQAQYRAGRSLGHPALQHFGYSMAPERRERRSGDGRAQVIDKYETKNPATAGFFVACHPWQPPSRP